MSVVWNAENVHHLLDRAGFGPKPRDVARYVKRGLAYTVEILVSQKANRAKGPGKSEANAAELKKLATWWCKRMASQNTRTLQEKMVLFWSGHFATQYSVVKNVRRMAFQNRLYRELGLGDMRSLLLAIVSDAAMLEFLDGRKNKKNAYNENFARELMELYVLGDYAFDGITPNYTEDDVFALTRATTGFQIDDKKDQGFFKPSRWDSGLKTLFHHKSYEATGALGVQDSNGNPLPASENVIDILLSHSDDAGNLTMPRFIGKKLWEFFGYPSPSPALVDEITLNFRAGGFVIADLLRSIFSHPEFYSEEAKSSSVKTPVEFAMSALRALDGKSKHTHTPDALVSMGMDLFDPPNVAGYPSGIEWLSSGQMLARFQTAQAIGSGRDKNKALLRMKKLIPKNATTEAEVVDEVLNRLGIQNSLPAESRQTLIDYFEGQNDFDDPVVQETKVRGMIVLALSLPAAHIH